MVAWFRGGPASCRERSTASRGGNHSGDKRSGAPDLPGHRHVTTSSTNYLCRCVIVDDDDDRPPPPAGWGRTLEVETELPQLPLRGRRIRGKSAGGRTCVSANTKEWRLTS